MPGVIKFTKEERKMIVPLFRKLADDIESKGKINRDELQSTAADAAVAFQVALMRAEGFDIKTPTRKKPKHKRSSLSRMVLR